MAKIIAVPAGGVLGLADCAKKVANPAHAVPSIFIAFELVVVNQPFVTLVAVAPIVVTKRLAHFFSVVPKSSVLSVSETREVLIAVVPRLSRAAFALDVASQEY